MNGPDDDDDVAPTNGAAGGEAQLEPDEPDEPAVLAEPANFAEPATADDVPCGLSIRAQTVGYIYYRIRNCHRSGVHRKVDIADWSDIGSCHSIPAGFTANGAISIPRYAYLRGIKKC